jgi:hypothetical protein
LFGGTTAPVAQLAAVRKTRAAHSPRALAPAAAHCVEVFQHGTLALSCF